MQCKHSSIVRQFATVKLLCSTMTHSEAKQTEMSEFGAEKFLLHGHARRWGDWRSKKAQAPLQDSANVSPYVLLNCGVGEDSWESLELQGDPTSPFWRRSALGFLWKEWCWNSSTLATSCEELTHWKRLWCWEGLGAGGEGDDRGWDGWMASLTRWTWVWVNSGRWWWTGRPGVLRFMGLQRVGHDWEAELNWTEL